MKAIYEAPMAEVMYFSTEDIMTESENDNLGDGEDLGDSDL